MEFHIESFMRLLRNKKSQIVIDWTLLNTFCIVANAFFNCKFMYLCECTRAWKVWTWCIVYINQSLWICEPETATQSGTSSDKFIVIKTWHTWIILDHCLNSFNLSIITIQWIFFLSMLKNMTHLKWRIKRSSSPDWRISTKFSKNPVKKWTDLCFKPQIWIFVRLSNGFFLPYGSSWNRNRWHFSHFLFHTRWRL